MPPPSLWTAVHRHILGASAAPRFLPDYDAFAAGPQGHLAALAAFVDVPGGTLATIPIAPTPSHTIGIADTALVREADALHRALQASSHLA